MAIFLSMEDLQLLITPLFSAQKPDHWLLFLITGGSILTTLRLTLPSWFPVKSRARVGKASSTQNPEGTAPRSWGYSDKSAFSKLKLHLLLKILQFLIMLGGNVNPYYVRVATSSAKQVNFASVKTDSNGKDEMWNPVYNVLRRASASTREDEDEGWFSRSWLSSFLL